MPGYAAVAILFMAVLSTVPAVCGGRSLPGLPVWTGAVGAEGCEMPLHPERSGTASCPGLQW